MLPSVVKSSHELRCFYAGYKVTFCFRLIVALSSHLYIMASPIASTSRLPPSDDAHTWRRRSHDEAEDPIPALRRLPPELIPTILSHVPPRLRTRTALALATVLPDYPVPQKQVYEHVVVGRAGQIMPLWKKMKDDEVGAGMVRTFALVSHQLCLARYSDETHGVILTV